MTALFGCVGAVPHFYLQMIPPIGCMTPETALYEKKITANGDIQAIQTKELYVQTPVLPDLVMAEVGDVVQKGQLLATVDVDTTQGILKQSIPASQLFQNSGLNGLDTGNLNELYTLLKSSGLLEGYGGILEGMGEFLPDASTTAKDLLASEYFYIPQEIYAPIDGVVTQVGLQEDILSQTSVPAFTISDCSHFIAKVTVGESYISDIQLGDHAVLTGSGFTGSYEGYVSKIYPSAYRAASVSAQEMVVDVEISISNPAPELKPGFSVRAEITTSEQRDMLMVPYEAVQQDEENVEYVFLAVDSGIVRRDIKTGEELFEGVEVVEGLTTSDVILVNAQGIEENEKVLLKGERKDGD